MKKYFYFLAASAVLSACSSATEEVIVNEPEVNVEQMTFHATVESEDGDTRAYVSSEKNTQNKYDVLWSADDAISVFDYKSGAGNNFGSTNSKMTLTDGVGKTEATFSGTCDISSSGYVAAYPYNANTSFLSSNYIVTYKWGSIGQTACLNSFPKEILMLAKCGSEMTDLKFKHVYSFIKFTTTGECTSVTFKANDDDSQIAGTSILVYFRDEVPSINRTDGASNQITLSGKDGAKLAAGTYYIAVLPCTMTGGFQITFANADTSFSYTRSTTKDVTMTRAKILNIGTFDLKNAFMGQATTEDLVSGGDFEW